MSEASGKEEHVKNPERRKFLKTAGKLALATAGVAVLGGIVANEGINKEEGGVITESGIFFPLYERHDKGIKVESIPYNLDVLFGEGYFGGQTFSLAPEVILSHKYNYSGKEVNMFPSKILAFLSQGKTEIMTGDVQTPLMRDIGPMIMVGEAAAGGTLAAWLLSNRRGRSKVDSKAGMGRRKFLRAVMLVGAAWGLSKVPLMTTGLLLEPYNENAIDRVFSRLAAIESHAHPEESMVFFRNAIMADKLLTVSEDIKERTGKKARIAFQVGSGHAGIEDFLQAGQDFCRGLILAYPKWYLRSTMELNNGIKDFSSARLFKLPENLTQVDIDSGGRLSETTERRVVDEKLEKALTLKLA